MVFADWQIESNVEWIPLHFERHCTFSRHIAVRNIYDDKCNLREYDDINSSRSNETYECVMK